MGFRWQSDLVGKQREMQPYPYDGYIIVDRNCRMAQASGIYGKTMSPKPVTIKEILDAAEAHKIVKRQKKRNSRAKKAGWIKWPAHWQAVCPVPSGTRVEVELGSGHKGETAAGNLQWGLTGRATIVAYRIVKVVKQEKKITLDALLNKVVKSIGKELVSSETGLGTATVDTNPKKQFGLKSIPLNLWSPLASAYGALGLYNGSLKYGSSNYKATKVEASIYIAAAMRHLNAWAEGEEFDPKDGVPNLGGVLANIAILLDARAAGTLIDDRQLPGGYLQEREALEKIVASLQVLHADKNPRHYTLKDKA